MNYLMLTPCECEVCNYDGNALCGLRTAYWADESNGGNNFDNPNYTGCPEPEVRKRAKDDPLWMACVKLADASGIAFKDQEEA